MKTPIALLLLFPVTLVATGCGEGDVKASEMIESGMNAAGQLESLDLSKLDMDGMMTKVDELSSSLGTQLKGIQDKASAMSVSETVTPLLDQLTQLKGALGGKMPKLDDLGGVVEDLKARFMDDQAVMKVIEPLLAKVQTLLG